LAQSCRSSSFKDMGDVIRRANRTTYGLAAGVVTRDVQKLGRSVKFVLIIRIFLFAIVSV
jgi:acyl-CoA reductase-like NAD-dependent aldehyde dehydrogenase